MTEKILRFLLKDATNPMEIFERFHPQGKVLLNRTEWRGKEPRTCSITRIHGTMGGIDMPTPAFQVEVTYRPPQFISYKGNTRYEGWTAMVLDQNKDGILLDGHGNPLKDGESPVYLPIEVYGDADFNDINFGDFVEEVEGTAGVKHVQQDDLMKEINHRIHQGGHFSMSMRSSFMAQHRQRPVAKILIVEHPREQEFRFNDPEVQALNKNVPHFTHVLYVRLLKLMTRFLQGEISIKSISDMEGGLYVQLSDSVVDGTPKDGQSRFNVLGEFLSPSLMDDLARQLASIFLIEVEVVDGSQLGFHIVPQEAKE